MKFSRNMLEKCVYRLVLPVGIVLVLYALYELPGKLGFLGRMSDAQGEVVQVLTEKNQPHIKVRYHIDGEAYQLLHRCQNPPEVGSKVPIMYYLANPSSAIYGSRLRYLSWDITQIMIGLMLLISVLVWQFIQGHDIPEEEREQHFIRMRQMMLQGPDWRKSPLRLLDTPSTSKVIPMVPVENQDGNKPTVSTRQRPLVNHKSLNPESNFPQNEIRPVEDKPMNAMSQMETLSPVDEVAEEVTFGFVAVQNYLPNPGTDSMMQVDLAPALAPAKREPAKSSYEEISQSAEILSFPEIAAEEEDNCIDLRNIKSVPEPELPPHPSNVKRAA